MSILAKKKQKQPEKRKKTTCWKAKKG